MMMNRSRWIAFSAALSIAFVLPGLTHAQSTLNSQGSQGSSDSTASQAGQEEAAQMVPARAYLMGKLEAKDSKPGSQFSAKLSENVQLKNGPKLPKGTVLMGTVVSDDMQKSGTSKFALRISEARLKDGSTVPLKATIVGFWQPESEAGYTVIPGDQEPNTWNSGVLKIDEINALSGVDLHSSIDGDDSGVFVAKKKDNVKIAAGSELALAIAQQASGQQTGQSGGAQ